MEFEKVTKNQVDALIRAAGIGAMIITGWDDIDYELGRGKNKDSHCLFTKDGKRIDIGGYGVGLIITQTRDADPQYEIYKKEQSICDNRI